MRSGPIYQGLFTLQRRLKGMVFFKIKVNACILIHPISTYFFQGIILKTLFSLYYHFLFFFFFSRSPIVVHFFLALSGDQRSKGNLKGKNELFFLSFGKKIAIQTECWKISSWHVGRDHSLPIGYIGSVSLKLANLRSHTSKLFLHKITYFHPLAQTLP